MSKTRRFNLLSFVVALVGAMVLHELLAGSSAARVLPYSEVQELLRQGAVKDVLVSGNELRGELVDPEDGRRRRFVSTIVQPELARELSAHGVRFGARRENTELMLVLSWVVPVALFLGAWVLLGRYAASRMGPGGMMSIGKSKAKVYVENETKVSFGDVAGVDEAKAELEETVAFLKDPKGSARLGARAPKGILLVGPPGTGKTLLARAVAGEAGVPFFSMSGSEFVELFVGVGAARVRDLFEQARHKAPCIIFIDELDALGKARNTQPGFGGHDEKEQTLNQLLVELDGFDSSAGIVLLGASNRPEILDPALLRAGRFDRQVLVDRPDKRGRAAILQVHARKVRVADGLSLDEVAALTPGFTGADLANLVNEAALAATRRGAPAVTHADFTTAIERIVAGLERKNRLLNEVERRIVAHHELGHALVAAALPRCDAVHKVSIIPRGVGALGYTIQRPTEDRYLMTREELLDKMTVLMGGRAAEQLVFGHLSTGAADDLAKASGIARSMVTRYAMDAGLGHVSYDDDGPSFLGGRGGFAPRRLMSDETAREIDQAVRGLVQQAYERAVAILAANAELLATGAGQLLEHETLDEAALRPLFARLRGLPSRPAPSEPKAPAAPAQHDESPALAAGPERDSEGSGRAEAPAQAPRRAA